MIGTRTGALLLLLTPLAFALSCARRLVGQQAGCAKLRSYLAIVVGHPPCPGLHGVPGRCELLFLFVSLLVVVVVACSSRSDGKRPMLAQAQ